MTLLTHWEGIAADGLGYRKAHCRITAMRHRLEPTAMQVTIDGVVVPPEPEIPASAEEVRQ